MLIINYSSKLFSALLLVIVLLAGSFAVNGEIALAA